MSTMEEIESAIAKLFPGELAALSKWMEKQMGEIEAKARALKATGGYLTEADNDFVLAVEEAGKGLPDNYEW